MLAAVVVPHLAAPTISRFGQTDGILLTSSFSATSLDVQSIVSLPETALYRRIRQIASLLNHHEQRFFVAVVMFMITYSLLEASLLVALYPFIGMMRSPDTLHSIWFLQWCYDTFGFTSDRSFLVASGALLLLLLILTNLVGAIRLWSQQRFGWMRVYSISHRLLQAYLRQPYAFFLSRSGAELS